MTRALEPRQWFSNDLDEHMAILQRQVDRSIRDGETRQLAVKIVSGAYDFAKDPRTHERVQVVQAFGHKFRAPDSGVGIPAKDEKGELTAIWDFVVLNYRYVYDPPHIDTFATAEKTLDAGGGDCDDGTILLAALLKSIGFFVKARVIATKDNPDEWVHVYPVVGMPKDNPRKWIALDATFAGATPGWEYPGIARYVDYDL
jgi:transglutaminase-like putative cysteine protease